MKDELIVQLQKQCKDLNAKEDEIFLKKRELETFRKIVDEKKLKAMQTVLEMSNDEVFKKELSNETKRQLKVKEILSTEKELFDNLEKTESEYELLQHQFSTLHRDYHTNISLAGLLSKN